MSLLLLGDPPFTPKSIPGLKLWLKADAITGLVDNDPVGTWPDVSGNGNDATQATAAKKPLYKVGILNGYPVVRADGVDDVLAAIVTATVAQTLVCVSKSLSGTSTTKRFWNRGTASGTGLYDNGGVWTYFKNQASGSVSFGGNCRTAFGIVTVRWNSLASADGFLNGTSVASFDSFDGYQATNDLTLADDGTGTQFLACDIAELVLYNRAITEAERLQLERAFGSKYALTVA